MKASETMWRNKSRNLRIHIEETGGTSSERLRLTRYRRRQTIDEVSAEVGISARTIKHWEAGHIDGASLFLVGCLAQYYGVSLDWLAFGKEDA